MKGNEKTGVNSRGIKANAVEADGNEGGKRGSGGGSISAEKREEMQASPGERIGGIERRGGRLLVREEKSHERDDIEERQK